MAKMDEGPYYYQLTPAQHRTIGLHADLARSIFKPPVFSASGGSWRWRSYSYISQGVDIKVDLLEGKVYYFRYSYVTESGLQSVTIPLDIFSDETVALTHWKLKPAQDDQYQDSPAQICLFD